MTSRSCHTCVYSYMSFAMECACFSPNFPIQPLCLNHPDSPGRPCEAPLKPCRNYRPNPDPASTPGPAGDIRQIPLSRGRFAIVDAADFEWLSRYHWTCRGGTNPYAARIERGRIIWMHREIMQTPPGLVCDHIDAVSLNNRRCNLRNCDRRQNSQNVPKRAHATSCYKGVSWDTRAGKWRAKIKSHGKAYELGLFVSEIEAALAYDRKARELFGPFARLNFPDEPEKAPGPRG
jgi:hypothetical protein